MENRSITVTPKLEKILTELGGNIKLARLRRKLTTEQVCERANTSRTPLWQLEKGMHNVTIGAYAQFYLSLALIKTYCGWRPMMSSAGDYRIPIWKLKKEDPGKNK